MSYLGTSVYPIVTLPALVTDSLGYQPVDSNTVTQLNTTTGSYANSAYATANTKFNTSGGTITGNTAVSVSSTVAALHITQTGTGNALVIEDESNPDSSPLVVDSSGNLGIGTTSNLASSKLDVRGRVRVGSGNSSGDAEVIWSNYASATTAWTASVRQDVGGANNDLKFLRFDSSGNYQGVAMQIDTSSRLNIGTTSNPTISNAPGTINLLAVGGDAINIKHTQNGNNLLNLWQTGTSGFSAIAFYKGDTQNIVGTISCTTTATTYNTSSDYRLKENVTSMTGALAKVAQLKPVTYTWKIDGSTGQGFIAHELQEVVPGAVTGEKDETYSNGNPKYQGVDASFLVATLTAAIQEQQLIINQLVADVAALKVN